MKNEALMNSKLKEIIGDSTGKEAALKISDWLSKNAKYNYYSFEDNHLEKALQHERDYVLNCSDEVVPGSNKRASKMRQLTHEKVLVGSPDFMDKWSSIVFKLHNLVKEELMAFGWNERQADYWIEVNVDFNHVKEHVGTDGKRYLSVDPKIGNKYVGFAAKLMESENDD